VPRSEPKPLGYIVSCTIALAYYRLEHGLDDYITWEHFIQDLICSGSDCNIRGVDIFEFPSAVPRDSAGEIQDSGPSGGSDRQLSYLNPQSTGSIAIMILNDLAPNNKLMPYLLRVLESMIDSNLSIDLAHNLPTQFQLGGFQS
jgi:hypothetical protein